MPRLSGVDVEIMNINTIIIVGALIALLLAVAYIIRNALAARSRYAVQRRSRVLSNAERSFYEELCSSLDDEYAVLVKVEMSQIIEPKPQLSNSVKSVISKSLENEHFDFVLCSRQNMSVFGVIELEHSDVASASKKANRQTTRNELISKLCENAGVRVFFFDARQNYKSVDLSRLIIGRSKLNEQDAKMSPTHQSQLTIETPSNSIYGHSRSCPKCRSEIVTKVALKGSDIGEKFLMCRKYPYCDYRVAVKDLERMREIEQKESKQAQTGGYKDWS